MNETKPQKPIVKLLYNGKDCTSDFSKYLNSVSFCDFENEQSDELSLSLNNNDGYFSDLWYPNKNDKLTCNFIYGKEDFSCGSLTIDENSFEYGVDGDFLEIKALATTTKASLRSNKIKNYSGKTLIQIAQEIGKTHGFEVLKTNGNVKVGTIIQKNESDISFLKRISREYGFIFNIKDGHLTFIELKELENLEPICTITRTDIQSLNLTDAIYKMYGKVKVLYLDNKTKTLKTYTAIGDSQFNDTLTIYKRCANIEEAKNIANNALKSAHKEIKGNIELNKPLINFIAGVNFNLLGFGKFDGKYHVISTKRTINSNGYKLSGEIEKCI